MQPQQIDSGREREGSCEGDEPRLAGRDTVGRSERPEVHMSSFFRMGVVDRASVFALCILNLMVTYLTDVWNLSSAHAAAIVNVFQGGTGMLIVVMGFIVDAFLGYHHLFIISLALICTGMSLLSLSAPPLLSKAVSSTQKCMYYTALPLLAIGFAGQKASSQRFKKSGLDFRITYKKLRNIIKNKLEPVAVICHDCGFLLRSFTFLVAVTLLFLLNYGGYALLLLNPWALTFGISTILIILAALLYLTGIGSYGKGIPKGSPLTTFFRVLVAATSRRSCPLPTDLRELHQENADNSMPHTNKLRCLDKAAIARNSRLGGQQERNRWKLCTVTEVEETKIVLSMIPLWFTFPMCGVVSAAGDTYFLDQGDQMNSDLGKLGIPLFTLVVFHSLGKTLISFLCPKVRDMFPKKLKKYVPPVGMLLAMLCSILCCVTAAAVERRRLDILKNHGDRMTVFWLIPQFLLLSALDAISKYSSTRFLNDQLPESLTDYSEGISTGLTGAGIMGSVIIVYVVGKAREIGGKSSWFQDDIDKSRLDNYYWSLAALSSVNLVLYSLAALRFPYRDPPENPEPDSTGEDDPSVKDDDAGNFLVRA